MKVLLSFFLITLGVFVTSCETFTSKPNVEFDLAKAHEQWNAHGFDHYTFEVSRTCECLPPNVYTVEVSDNKVTDVLYEEKDYIHYERRDILLQFTLSIEQLFDLLGHHQVSADQYEVEFHNELGYPTKVTIDPSREMADEEIILSISNLRSLSN
ncbi:MAG: DUF6174 domain-containing protein [Balneolaceae bacterium]